MADHHRWLEILQNTTTYRELQSVFSLMLMEANANADTPALAASIDEAIQRIEQERTRDSAELENATAQYDAFKQERSGVLGWFKRTLPFTETRKQELGHRGVVADQKAEILADNFVIARAQMLKERILPASSRRFGFRPNDWRDKLQPLESISKIRDFGSAVMDLENELDRCKSFTEMVRLDIEAFVEANFTDKEDQSRRDIDLNVARAELRTLDEEYHEKDSLRGAALMRLADLIENELTANDGTFRTTSERAAQTKEIVEHLTKATKLVEERYGALTTVVGKLGELDSIPEQRKKLEDAIRKLRRDLDDAEHRGLRAATDLVEPTNLYNNAVRDANQAKSDLNAAKMRYDSSRAQQNEAEVRSNFDFGESASAEAEFEQHKNRANQANDTLRRVAATLENAKKQVELAEQEAVALQKKIDQHSKEIDSLVEKERQLKRTVDSSRDSLERTQLDYHAALHRYSSLLDEISWLENHRSLAGVPADLLDQPAARDILPSSFSWQHSTTHGKYCELLDFEQQSTVLARLSKSIKTDHEVLKKALTQLAATRRDALKQRGSSLLDSRLAAEIKFDKEPS